MAGLWVAARVVQMLVITSRPTTCRGTGAFMSPGGGGGPHVTMLLPSPVRALPIEYSSDKDIGRAESAAVVTAP